MAHRLPHDGHGADLRQEPEEGAEHDGQLGDVVAVDVDVGDQADEGGHAHEDAPVPLPAAPDGPEALLGRQEEPAVLAQHHEREHEREREGHGEAQRDLGARADGVYGRVAPRGVDEGAIGVEQRRRVGREGQDAPRAVGQRAVAVELVAEALERRGVEVDAAQDRVDRAVAGEREELACVEDGHGRDGGRTGRMVER